MTGITFAAYFSMITSLTRKEVLIELKKQGCKTLSEFKERLREYENYYKCNELYEDYTCYNVQMNDQEGSSQNNFI